MLKNVSGVPQVSILGPSFSNLSINDQFYFITGALVYNFADDNTLSAFAKTIMELISILERESVNIVNWFDANKMLVNPDKC